MKKNEISRVLIYCRESRDEGYQNYDRIETQRDILVSFCQRMGYTHIVDIIMDDNKSGANFDRLLPVKTLVENKEIDIFVCKDASRIGRNILESLSFIEFLDRHGVALIFESEEYNEDMFPLIAWFNERRIKDDSLKIRRVLRHKMETGELVIRAPFGYDKKNGALIPNKKTAPIVSRIFELYLSGYTMAAIAETLSNNNISTPKQWGKEGDNPYVPWRAQQIKRILTNPVYIGDMVYGKREKASYKSNQYITRKKEDWIVIPNHHEPIISGELFQKTEDRLKSGRHKCIRHKTTNPLSGLVFCGGCGSVMYRKSRKNRHTAFICAKSLSGGGNRCTAHGIRETVLIDLVRQFLLDLVCQLPEETLQEAYEKSYATNYINQQIRETENAIRECKNRLSTLYEDKISGLLPLVLYQEKMEQTQQQMAFHHSEYTRLKQEKQTVLRNSHCKSYKEQFAKDLENAKINRNLTGLLLEKIIIYLPGEGKKDSALATLLNPGQYKEICREGGLVFVPEHNLC